MATTSTGSEASGWLLLLYHVALGIKPGTPVFTTGLNLYSVLIFAFISFMALSGMVGRPKLSLIRPGFLDVVKTDVPRCNAQASKTWAGVWLTLAARPVITGSSSNLGSIA